MQFAAGQRWLDHVAGIHATLCASTRADKSVQLIDEDDQLVTALPDLVNDPAHALLEVAAVAGPSDHSGELELYDTLALQHARDLAIGDTLRDAFGDRRLADPRLADQHRVILAPPGQHLDGLFDLAVATDHWVDPALPGQGGQVTAELIKRGGSGPATRSRRPALSGRNRVGGQRGLERFRSHPGTGQHAASRRVGVNRQCEQDVLGPDIGRSERARDLMRIP